MNTTISKQEILARYATKYEGEWSYIANALKTGEPVPTRQAKGSYITIYDDAYPSSLRSLRFPPWVLFYRGNLNLLNQQAMTIVGSRELGAYGRQMTEISTSMLCGRYVIVSGLAKGADGIAHRTAIGKGGKTIGVIGCGLNVRYPRENEYLYRRMERDHLILSEYPEHTGVKRHHFPWRNRILAALGEGIIVTQASLKSGTMLTVNEGLNLGKEVWCFPYPCGMKEGEGCNLLISQGANIVYDLSVLEDLHPLKAI